MRSAVPSARHPLGSGPTGYGPFQLAHHLPGPKRPKGHGPGSSGGRRIPPRLLHGRGSVPPFGQGLHGERHHGVDAGQGLRHVRRGVRGPQGGNLAHQASRFRVLGHHHAVFQGSRPAHGFPFGPSDSPGEGQRRRASPAAHPIPIPARHSTDARPLGLGSSPSEGQGQGVPPRNRRRWARRSAAPGPAGRGGLGGQVRAVAGAWRAGPGPGCSGGGRPRQGGGVGGQEADRSLQFK